MQVDFVRLSLSPREVADLVRNLPLPSGVSVGDVALTERGLDVTVRASVLLGLPMKFRVEIDRFSGSKVFVKVSPPVKPNWLLVRPMVLAIPGARYAGHSMIEIDLVSLSRGYLSGIDIKGLSLNRNGFTAEAAPVTSPFTWQQVLSFASSH